MSLVLLRSTGSLQAAFQHIDIAVKAYAKVRGFPELLWTTYCDNLAAHTILVGISI